MNIFGFGLSLDLAECLYKLKILCTVSKGGPYTSHTVPFASNTTLNRTLHTANFTGDFLTVKCTVQLYIHIPASQ
jgi:hypothetical protein